MKPKTRALLSFALLSVLGQATVAQGDPEVIQRLITEGKENSQVWESLTYLSEDIGARLTGSTACDRANAWTRDEFHRLGLRNAHLHKWGEIPVRFDRGPSRARMVAPFERELEFTAPAWSAGTEGPVRARVVLRPETMEDLEAFGWDFEDAWVLGKAPERRRRRGPESDEDRAKREEREAITTALREIGIAGTLTGSSSDLVLTSSRRGWRELTMDTLPEDVDVRIRKSDYEALVAQLEADAEVIVEIELAHHFTEGPFGVYNTVAEIPGVEKPEEVVIMSGHLDTWDGPGSQGAQDNGTGCAVMLEAARILMAVDVQPKRTIRFILWTGEEQGLFGSRGYVQDLTEEERALVSACFVDDGGTNYQGGLSLIASQEPMLAEAVAPTIEAFPEYEMELSVRERMSRFGGSDHSSFNQVGIPGYFWMEKGSGGRWGKNYNFIHHTQNDTMRYAVEEYLVQSATNTAVVAYNLAQADTLLPRETGEEQEETEPAVDPTFELTKGELSGEWEVSFTSADAPDFGFTLAIEMATDGRLRGTMTGMAGTENLKDGKWDRETKKATFAAVTDFGELAFAARVEEGVLRGTLSAMGTDMPFKGERTASESPIAESPISGRWEGLITSMDAEITLMFQVDEAGMLTGRFQSSQSDSELFDGKWNAEKKTLSFEYDYPHAGRLPVEARLEGDKLVGTIGENADFEATRSAID